MPNLLLRWEYEGEREELRGEQVAPIGARVHDDVFGEAILRGEQPGKLVVFIDGEVKVRTAGHVYYEAPAPLCPTDVVSSPEEVGGEEADGEEA